MKAILGLFLLATACTLSGRAATEPSSKLPRSTSDAQVPEGLAKSDWQSIRAAYEAGRHQFYKQEDGSHVAVNPGMGWQMTFDDKGFTAQPEDKAWTWGLEVASSGTRSSGDVRLRVPLEATGNRLSRQLSPAITEWFVNDARGLEQGWTLSAPAEIRLRVRGNLKPSVSSQSISFGGQLTYSGLKAWDATGKTIPTHFEATAEGFAVRYDDAGAQYPITIDPIAQQAYLKASNTGMLDNFGNSVAVSGDTVVIGASSESSNATGVNGNQANDSAIGSGAAYVFVRSGGVWSQQAYLKASNTGASDRFGYSVAVSGDTVVIGAPFEDSNATGVEGNQANNSASDAGAAYVFVRSGGVWTQQAYLKASNTGEGDWFGWSVAVSDDTVAIGAYLESSNATGVNGNQADNSASQSGAAYVFTRSGSVWTQQAYLKASNTGAEDGFGSSVALAGDTVVIGSAGEDSTATGVNGNEADNSASRSGAAYIFYRSGSTWTQQAYLKASNTGADDFFGGSVAVSGDTVVIGALEEDSNATGVGGDEADNSAATAGAAYVFTRSGGTWTQQAYLKASNTGAGDVFGGSVAVLGDTVVIGASSEDSNATGVGGNQANESANNSGAAYVFTRSGITWTQQAYLKASNTGAGDSFGGSVAVSGDTVVIGATSESSNAIGVGGNQADNSAMLAGAAYTFTLPLTPTQVFDAAMTAAGLSGPNAALDATPYGDGVPNLLKYAFNLNLSGPDAATMPPGGNSGLPGITAQPNGGTSVFRFEFLRRKNSGLIYTPQKSGELANPTSWVPLTDSPTVISIDANWERVIYEEPYDATTVPRCFGRVQVTLP